MGLPQVLGGAGCSLYLMQMSKPGLFGKDH